MIALLSETLATGCVSRRLAMLGPLSCAVGGCGLWVVPHAPPFDVRSAADPVTWPRSDDREGDLGKTCTWLGGSSQVKSSRNEWGVQLFNIAICKLNVYVV